MVDSIAQNPSTLSARRAAASSSDSINSGTMDFATLEHYGVPVIPYSVVNSLDGAQKAAAKLKFPVALKLISAKFLHKSDSGALALNVIGPEKLALEYDRLAGMARSAQPSNGNNLANANGASAEFSILVQAFRPGRSELIVGGRLDPQFGPVILLGLGGVYAEVLRDTSLRVCPIDEREAAEMIHSLKCYPILAGARGRQPIDEAALIKILMGVSKLMIQVRPSELDINPLLVRDDGLWAAGARIIR